MCPSKPNDQAVDAIVSDTENRCERVGSQLRDTSNRLSRDPERVFAAFFTGNHALLHGEADPSSQLWASWIEGVPPLSSLFTNDHIIVDLIPPKNPSDFIGTYGCTAGQFAEALKTGRISLNLRNHRHEYSEYRSNALLRPIFETFTSDPGRPPRFYCLDIIRKSAFESLGVDLDGTLVKSAQVLLENYVAPTDAGHLGDKLKFVSRDHVWPPSGQVEYRLAYYLAARALWPRLASAEEREQWSRGHWSRGHKSVDDLIGDSSEPKPIPASALREPEQLVDFLSAIYASHHLYTARLTGALGGVYGWLPHEFNFVTQHYGLTPVDNIRGRRIPMLGLADFIFTKIIGHDVTWTKGTGVPNKPTQAPTAPQWAAFLRAVDNHKTRSDSNELAEALSSTYAGDYDKTSKDDIAEVIDSISRNKGTSVLWKAYALGANTTEAILKGVKLCDMNVWKVLGALYRSAKEQAPQMADRLEALEAWIAKLNDRRVLRSRVVGALDRLEQRALPPLTSSKR